MSDPKDKHFEQAHKNVQRGRHQFIMQLARQGFKRDEINGVVNMIDWGSETLWIAEEMRANEAKTPAPQPVPIPPPPTDAPQVQ